MKPILISSFLFCLLGFAEDSSFTFDAPNISSFEVSHDALSKACFNLKVEEEKINQRFKNTDGTTTFLKPRLRFAGRDHLFYDDSSVTLAILFCQKMGFKTLRFTETELQRGPFAVYSIAKEFITKIENGRKNYGFEIQTLLKEIPQGTSNNVITEITCE